MICANCGAERPGSFCGHCGQNDRDYQRALPPLLADLLRETFEIDSRLVRTLTLLLMKPGELAAEFSRNRRASYVSPLRLYLFVSIAFFFLLSMTTEIPPLPSERPVVSAELKTLAGTDSGRLVARLEPAHRQKVAEILERPDTSVAKLLLLQLAQALEQETESPDAVEVYLIGRLVDVLYEPGSALDQLMDNLPVALFIMLPIYALLLKLFYFDRHRYYVENLVFATHLQTFAFLAFIVMLLLPEATGSGAAARLSALVANALWIGLAVYHYLALRRYYGGGRLVTGMKLVGLLALYLLLLTPAAFGFVVAFTLATL